MPEIGLYRLAAALADYTDGPTYLNALIEGAPRYDLDGNERGKVSADEAEHALHRMRNYVTAGGQHQQAPA